MKLYYTITKEVCNDIDINFLSEFIKEKVNNNNDQKTYSNQECLEIFRDNITYYLYDAGFEDAVYLNEYQRDEVYNEVKKILK